MSLPRLWIASVVIRRIAIYKRLRYSNIRFFTFAEGEIALPSPRGGQWNELRFMERAGAC